MSARVRLIFALHNHQPVGNFDSVFEEAYRHSYLPFLDLIEGYPEIPVSLHTSGPLMEWLIERKPEYVSRLRDLAQAGRVEILGGGFFEPILTMIPHRDRVGQIRTYSQYLEEKLGQRVRGAWLAERVWEQHLVSALVEAGIEYTVLDDFHFQRAGEASDDLFGYYLTEDEGRLLKVFPNSESMRYLTPWSEPHAAYEFLRDLAQRRPNAVVVCGDDGEKFGGWPQTFEHVYEKGWFRHFLDMIRGNLDWIEPTTFSGVLDSAVPLGKVYLPDASYREMTEWVLPARQLSAYEAASKRAKEDPAAAYLSPYVRAGGYWRNFKSKYPESDEMYTRMLGLSNRLARLEAEGKADPDYLDIARQELFRSQCNCPYWHGAFGGLYLPHLRNAIYKHLIGCHNALDESEGRVGERVRLEVGDFNLDGRQEVMLENDRMVALVRPTTGGHLYELDIRHAGTNLLATLDRRPESYHGTIAAAAGAPQSEEPEGPSNLHDRVILKQEGLDQLLVYDRAPRKALVDHFFPLGVSLDDLAGCRDVEQGDFATGTYLSQVVRSPGRVELIMRRTGYASGHAVSITKTLALRSGSSVLEVDYVLEDLPVGQPLHFAVELNLASMAGHAEDRYYSSPTGQRLGFLDDRLDLPYADGIRLTDEWLDVGIDLHWSQTCGLWCFPVATASQSEGGFEAIYQSSVILPHWIVTGDDTRRWSVRLNWAIDRARMAQVSPSVTGRETARAAR